DNSEEAVDATVRDAVEALAGAGLSADEVSIPWHLHGARIWDVIATEGATAQMVDGNGYGLNWQGRYDPDLMDYYGGKWRSDPSAFSETVKLVMLADLAAEDPTDWRIAWTDGLRRLAVGEAGTDGAGAAAAARGAFSAVYDDLPGELAPKLALAFAAETAGDAASAARYFKLVWTVDRSCISAAFGLARACLAIGDRPGAIAALAAVPETSSYHAAAQIAAVRILVSSGMTGDDLHQASGRLGRLALDEARRQQLTVEILRAALGWASSDRSSPSGQAQGSSRSPARTAGDGLILGCEPNERSLRFGLERGYRALARLTSDRSRRIELVDMANAVRPKTWS
ncbi:MAG: tetratricopeptide repeat protein, partial [Streptosporangiaceae bacterium]